MIFNRKQLAECLGVDERTLARWADDEQMPVERRGKRSEWRADPARVVAWLLERERAKDDTNAEVSAQRARLLKLQADRVEVDNRERIGQLVSVAAVKREYGPRIAGARDALLAVPDRIAARCAASSDPELVHTLIANEIKLAMSNLQRSGEGAST